MINNFLQSKLTTAKYSILDDGSFYAEIKSCPGVWANAKDLESCRRELSEVLEEWLLLKVYTREKVANFDFFKIALPV